MRSYALIGSSSAAAVQAAALALLRPHLPVALPLYRRLQFGRFFDASALLTNVDLDLDLDLGDDADTKSGTPRPERWLVAFVDRSCRPETEVWMFGNWEDEREDEDEDEEARGSREAGIDALVRDLLVATKSIGVPASMHEHDVPDERRAHRNASSRSGGKDEAAQTDSAGLSRNDYGRHAALKTVMLWGAVHARSVPALTRAGVVAEAFRSAVVPNWTFVWDVAALGEEGDPLPEGLRWGEVRRQDLGLVRSRTMIPRLESTLAGLPSVAVFPAEGEGEAPVAWAFVGLDGSLTSLHVEPEWRRRGLAKAVTKRLFTHKMDSFWEDGEGLTRWAHGNVIVGNKQSEGMCRSIGGRSDYECFWLRVDIDKA